MTESIVRVGQVWRSKDKRDGGLTVTVLQVGNQWSADFVQVQRLRKTWIQVSTLLRRYELTDTP